MKWPNAASQASCSGPIHRCWCSRAGSRSQGEQGNRQARPRIYLPLSLRFFPLLTPLISSPPRRFVSAVALAQYLPDPISLALCFPPDVSTFSLSSTSASLFFPTVYFTYSDSVLFWALSHECCFLFLTFLPWIFFQFFLFKSKILFGLDLLAHFACKKKKVPCICTNTDTESEIWLYRYGTAELTEILHEIKKLKYSCVIILTFSFSSVCLPPSHFSCCIFQSHTCFTCEVTCALTKCRHETSNVSISS